MTFQGNIQRDGVENEWSLHLNTLSIFIIASSCGGGDTKVLRISHVAACHKHSETYSFSTRHIIKDSELRKLSLDATYVWLSEPKMT